MSYWGKPNTVTIAARLVAERHRQVEKGFTLEHDDEHKEGDLAMAAACYAADEAIFVRREGAIDVSFKDPWPWEGGDARCRPLQSNYPTPELVEGGDRIRMLEKAGAMIIAEIERLERLELVKPNLEYFEAAKSRVEALSLALEHMKKRLKEMPILTVEEALERLKKPIPIARDTIDVPVSDAAVGAESIREVEDERILKELDKHFSLPEEERDAIIDEVNRDLQTGDVIGEKTKALVDGVVEGLKRPLTRSSSIDAVLGEVCPKCKGKKVVERGFDGDPRMGAKRPIMGPCLECEGTGKQ